MHIYGGYLDVYLTLGVDDELSGYIHSGYLDVYLTLSDNDELSGCIFMGTIWMSTLLYVSTMSYLDA